VARERKWKRDSARWGDRNTGQGYRLGNAERAARAREMRAQGMTYKAIAEALGVSLDTARRWSLR